MSKSILSVNGNKAMSYLLQTILKKEYKFVPANDVFHGMYHLKANNSICALVIDLDFQIQQSWELIEHIKSSRLYNLPVIVLTSDNNEILKKKCYEFEVDEVFIKPFNPLDLIAAIKSMTSAEAVID